MELTSWQKLDKYFSKKSMMEIMGVDRDENAHSNFLAWLFENELTGKVACRLLVNLLVQNIQENQIKNNVEHKNIDYLSELKINKINVIREDFVHADYLKNKMGPKEGITYVNEIIESLTQEEVREVKGRSDILININGGEFFIVIENKVDSTELCKWWYGEDDPGIKPKDKELKDKNNINRPKSLWQTQFYYDYYSKQYGDNKVAYAFLTLPNNDGPECEKFIHITYQNIMDYILIPIKDIASGATLFQIDDYIKALGINYSQDKVMAVPPELKELANQLLETNGVLDKLYNLRQKRVTVERKDITNLIEFWNSYTNTGVAYRDILRPFFEVLTLIKKDKDNKDGRDGTNYRNINPTEDKKIEPIGGKNALFRWIVEKYIVEKYKDPRKTPSVEELQLVFPPSLHGKTVSAREGSCTDKNIIIGEQKLDFGNIYEDDSFVFWNNYRNNEKKIYICQTGWDGPSMMSRLIKYAKENITSLAELNIQEVPSFLKK